ncbi:lymphocyte antigen 6 complex locus protein G5c [Meriones unguiculatus]|uniref:lymphocyte antigen 6 complex locus protein G5c n=1 Tax=Meriones unguiculatus TaxID=10047 RepID=UPI000B4ECACC|nr:lymphocyte antigen 6 complex locus protein G5c [Meriones unguiculatus]
MLFMVGPAASWTPGPLSLHRASPALSAVLSTAALGNLVLGERLRRREQTSDCSYTRASPVSGFRILCQCCCLDFCNNPKSKEAAVH